MSNKSLVKYPQPAIIPTFSGKHSSTAKYSIRPTSFALPKAQYSLFVSLLCALLAAALGLAFLHVESASANQKNAKITADTLAKNKQANNLSLGSSVFLDVNANGLFDSNETGIENVSLTVYNALNTLVATATTDISGTYLITGLEEGNYYVIIQNPPANAPTSSNVTSSNDDQIDNDDNGDQPGGPGAPVISPIIRLVAGDEPIDESGQGGELDDLTDDSGDMTVDFGFVPTDFSVTVGDFVWNDLNRDGIQDEDEPGLPDVTVAIFNTNTGLPLVDADGNPRTVVTDEFGQFLFADLSPGNFYLTLSDIPIGFEATVQNVGSNDSVDSDLYSNVSQTTPTGPLVDGVQYTALDAGLFDREAGLVADIGDRVWYDYDGDGIQGTSPDEYGLTDVAITLYDSANRSILQSTTTDVNGDYTFVRIPAGNYFLEFTSPNEFLIPVWPGRSSNQALDSDINSNGQTGTFALVGGEDVSSVDAGFVLPAELDVNFWNDSNQDGVRDATEAGFNGAQVILVTTAGERLADVLTDIDGIARFSVPPGEYRLQFTPPGGFEISQRSTFGAINNDADEDGLTDTLTLMPGETITEWGAGAYEIRPSSLPKENEPDEDSEIGGEDGSIQLRSWLYLPLID